MSRVLGYCNFLDIVVKRTFCWSSCGKAWQFNSKSISVFSKTEPNGSSDAWQKALTDAEKVVGFPTSFLSLRALLSDEFGGLAIHLRKLISTKHPLLNTARGMVFDSKNYMQTRGLVVLLVSKAASFVPAAATDGGSIFLSTAVAEKQRSLAEITELVHIGFLVHRGIVDTETLAKTVSKSDIDFGNKLTLLGGDFMLANACTGLAKLENTKVVDLMSAAIGDMSTSCIILPEGGAVCDRHTFLNIPTGRQQWINVIRLANGSLLANACHSALLLASSEQCMIDSAEHFAHQLILAQQARQDILRLSSLTAWNQKPNSASLCSLPVVLMAERMGGIDWLRSFTTEVDGVNLEVKTLELYQAVVNDGRAIKLSNDLCVMHADNALKSLAIFPESKAKNALKNIVCSVKQ